MLVIRLFRTGKKNQPSFKIVVTDKRRPPRAGRFLEEVGFYNSLTKERVLKTERIKYWLSVGAKPSDTVYNLLISEKIIEGKKIPLHKVSKKEKPSVVPVTPVAPAAAEVVAGKEEPAPEKEKPAPEKEKKEEVKETPEKRAKAELAREIPKEKKPVKEV